MFKGLVLGALGAIVALVVILVHNTAIPGVTPWHDNVLWLAVAGAFLVGPVLQWVSENPAGVPREAKKRHPPARHGS
jgi:hypothetical protein